MLNSVVLMGRLVQAPEVKQTPNGTYVATIRVAVNRTYNSKQTDYINVVAWRHQAEFVGKYFDKGDLIIIEGSIQTRSYQDKKRNKRNVVEVLANQIHFGQTKKASKDLDSHTVKVICHTIPDQPVPPAQSTDTPTTGPYEPYDADDQEELPFAPIAEVI